MIHEFRSKVSDAPEDNYTVAVCDGCKARCEASRLPGRRGFKASDEADALAVRAGYVHRDVTEYRQPGWTVQLLCPSCAEIPARVLAEVVAAYCCEWVLPPRGGWPARHCARKRGHGPMRQYCRAHAAAAMDGARGGTGIGGGS